MEQPAAPRVADLLRKARAHIETGDAAVLLAHVLGRSRGWLYGHDDDTVTPAEANAFKALVIRRLSGEPVAYLVGRRGFWQFELEVTPATLIPRPETELLVELALAQLPRERASHVVDLGTGSGAIALALAYERPLAHIVGVDASRDALAVAQRNAQHLRLPNVEFRQGDWLAPLAGEKLDAIVGNPPYIAIGDPHLRDLRYEPASALASGVDGLDAIRAIARDAPACLVPGGWLLLEHGWEQGEAVRALLAAAGFIDVATERDLENRDRVTLGRKP